MTNLPARLRFRFHSEESRLLSRPVVKDLRTADSNILYTTYYMVYSCYRELLNPIIFIAGAQSIFGFGVGQITNSDVFSTMPRNFENVFAGEALPHSGCSNAKSG